MKNKLIAFVMAACLTIGVTALTGGTAKADGNYADGIYVTRVESYIDSTPKSMEESEFSSRKYYRCSYETPRQVFYLDNGQVIDTANSPYHLPAETMYREGLKLNVNNLCEDDNGLFYSLAEGFTASINGVEVSPDFIIGDFYITVPVEAFPAYGLEPVPMPDQERLIYRLFDSSNGDHVYTQNPDEKNALVAAGWTLEPSPGFSSDPESGMAVYRLKNEASGEHIFTADEIEKNSLAKAGWIVENGGEPVFYGVEERFKSYSGVFPVYRLFNPNAQSAIDSHHYTMDKNEIKGLTEKFGWEQDNNGEPVFYLSR